MDQRISRAVAFAVIVTLPLLAGCGSASAVSDGAPAPTLAQAPASPEPTSPDTTSPETASPDTAASVTPSPTDTPTDTTADPAVQTQQVQAVTTRFVTSVLTLGYPDRSFDTYLARIRPQMTKKGFDSLESAESTKKGTAALKSLYPQRARSAPKFSGEPEVTSLEATSATAQLDYENIAQRKDGADWKTLKLVGTGSVTVKLVREGGTWLVDDAS